MEKIITQISEAIDKFQEEQTPKLEKLREKGTQLMNATNKIERSWSGSFAGWHGRMYYGNFEPPPMNKRFSLEWGGINGIPEGWRERESEEVVGEIERLIGNQFSVKQFEEDIASTASEAKALKDDITSSLAALKLGEGFEKERALLEQAENFKLGEKRNTHIHNRIPGKLISRDTEALFQGICIASHLYYEGVGFEATSLSEALLEYIRLINRLAKQIRLKNATTSPETSINLEELRGLHPKIFDKCQALFEQKAYSEAVEKSFKIVRDKLRSLTGHETGSEAFGKGGLYIRGAAAANVDEDFNKGVQFLTMAIDRFRNEKSHTSDGNIEDPARASQYLVLSSLALSFLENSEIRK